MQFTNAKYRTHRTLQAAIAGICSKQPRAATAEHLETRRMFTTYYVNNSSSTASDNNAGTSINAPLATITQALNLVANDNHSTQSDTVLISGGVYREQPFVWPTDSGASATSRTVISAATDPTTGNYEPVYIDAADPTTGTWTQDGTSNRWYLSSFTTQTSGVWVDWSGSNDGASLQQIGTYNAGFPDTRTIFGSGVSSMYAGTYYGDVADSRLYVWLKDGSNPNNHTLEFANRARAIYQPGSPNGNTYTWASNVDFVGLSLRHANVYNTTGQDNDCAIYTENNERMINCNIQWNPTTGVFLNNTSQLINCDISNNGRMGVECEGSGWLISGGIYDGNYWRLYIEGGEAGIKIITNNALLYGDIENAEIGGNYGKGIWYDTDYDNTVISHITGNYIHDNEEQGIDLEASRNFVVANNVITNNHGSGIVLDSDENVQLDNNTFVGNHGIAAIEVDGGSRVEEYNSPAMIDTLNDSFENNIIANNYSIYDMDLPTDVPSGGVVGNLTSDYNLFYHNGESLKFSDGGQYYGWYQTPSTLSAWQSDTSEDAHSIMADPLFISGGTGAAAYQIGTNSPAIGLGAKLTSTFTTDYSGTTRPTSTGYDLGAYQHLGSATGTASSTSINTDPTVWVDDELPTGSAMTPPDAHSNLDENRFWEWNSTSAYSGNVSDDSGVVSGAHRQYFSGATARSVASTDQLFAYVWIDPQNLPTQIMFEWQDSSGSWAHQAYWGANQIGAGVDGSVAGQSIGALPAAGQWVKLSVPASTVGLAGKQITGFSFDLYNGRALIDDIGNGPAGASPVGVTPTTPTPPNQTQPPQTVGTISGTVFIDSNGDGVDNTGEIGLSGRTVFLDLNNNGVDNSGDPTTSTNSTGGYTFSNVSAGTYTVRQVLTSGSIASTTSGQSYTVTVTSGGTAQQNFGVFFNTFTSSASGGNITVGLSANGQTADIWQSVSESSTPSYAISKSQLPSLTFAGGGANTTFTIDYTNGDPLPGGTINFNGTGVETLAIIGAPTASNTFSVSASAITINALNLNFSNVATITINGGSGNDVLNEASSPVPVTFNGSTGSDTINVNSGAVNFASDPEVTTNNLTLNVARAASAIFAAGPAGNGIKVFNLAALNVASGGTVTLNTRADLADRSILVVGALTFGGSNTSPTGTLNLSNNDLIVRNGNLTTLTAAVTTGANSGTWAGSGGIVSSAAASSPSHENAIGIANGLTGTFDGQAISAGDVALKYTLYGDANLDGTVDASDYALINAGISNSANGWSNGDFNYDGTIDGSDYTLIDDNLNTQLTAPVPQALIASSAAVVATTPVTTLKLTSEAPVVSYMQIAGSAAPLSTATASPKLAIAQSEAATTDDVTTVESNSTEANPFLIGPAPIKQLKHQLRHRGQLIDTLDLTTPLTAAA